MTAQPLWNFAFYLSLITCRPHQPMTRTPYGSIFDTRVGCSSSTGLPRGGVRLVSDTCDVQTEPYVSPANRRVTDGARTRDLRSDNPFAHKKPSGRFQFCFI